eukprot:TRINITY_DN10_c0_g1_i1.p1 TRINITY_DN10_c0_g1~~TRINITY_DN10_c0_g1_i1.p1  ORF type:complete len:335 (+),score=104.71 TRINITY_DN10_c0_g1_i1:75-1079(+)
MAEKEADAEKETSEEKKADEEEKKDDEPAEDGGVCQYDVPDIETLDVEPDSTLLAKIEYKCTSFDVTMKDANQLLSYISGRPHAQRLKTKNLTEDPDIKEKLERLKELERPHRDKKREDKKESSKNRFKELLAKKKEERDAMTPAERAEADRLAKERKRAANNAPDQRPKKKPKNFKFEPVHCYITDTLLHTPSEVRNHFSSRAYWSKAADDPAMQDEETFKSRKHRLMCTRMHAMGIDPSDLGIRDDYSEDKTPYKCPVTEKTVYGYKELKAHMQSDEYAEAAIEYADGCDICGFKSEDQTEVLNHYLSQDHMARLHHLAYYGMDVSNYYIGV